MSTQGEMWKVSTVEGIFEADLETLKQWIVEGCVLPTDKVTRGSMSWIEAGKAPMLRGAFNGELSSVAVVTTDAAAQTQAAEPPPFEAVAGHPVEEYEAEPTPYAAAPDLSLAASQASACHNHPDVEAKYICRVCTEVFCNDCPRFIGSSKVPLCPLCGDLCRLIGQERERVQRQVFRTTPFGFEDLGRAVKYPFQHVIALLFGGLLYGFLLLAGMPGFICALVLLYGCVAIVINHVAHGRLDRSFMPDFSEFNLWDDLVVRVFLAIGIFLVTWGPTALLILIFIFGVLKTAPITAFAPHEPSAYSQAQPGAEGSSSGEAENGPGESAGQEQPRFESPARDSGSSSVRSESSEAISNYVSRILTMGAVLLPFFLLSVLWGFFYYPMALTVAGYTEQFSAVMNPLVGLDTIKRMGLTYFKAFGMVILIQIVGGIAGLILQIIFLPFNLPMMGNLPAKFVNGGVTFYLYLVIACVLGLALHKSADRLDINYD
jgi:hypothetical protein